MNSFFQESLFAGLALSLVAYVIGMALKKKLKIGIFHPLLISIIISIAVLAMGNVEYEVYQESAKYLSYLLTPATVCLAIPLYEQWELLKKNYLAVVCGLIAGVITSLATVFGLAVLFHLSHREYVTLLPKSITTAIGIGLSQELDGYVAITVSAIMITGLFGNIAGGLLCRILGIKDPIAKGIAIGTASHVMGTAKAMELGKVEGAMSSLSVAVAGAMTVGAAILFQGLI